MTPAIQKLANAIAETLSYDTVPADDAPVMIDNNNCLFELNTTDEFLGVRITFGDLRAIINGE